MKITKPPKSVHKNVTQETYSDIEQTTGQSRLHSELEEVRLSRYNTLSHQAGIRFFSPAS